MGFGGSGGSGSGSIASSSDAAVSNPVTGQVLTYSSLGKWQNVAPATAAVSSVAGKSGVVTLVEGDVANLTTDLSAKAADSAVVHNTGAETIAGAKTFTSTIVGSISGVAANVTTNANLTGDVTSTGNATTIAPNAVTNAKAVQMPAGTLKGNSTGATANAADLTTSQVKTMLAIAESDVTNLTTDLAAKASTASLATVATSGSYADLSNKPSFVDLASAQSVGGVKTFTSLPVIPSATPTTATQVASKGYVDANVGASVGSATPLALGSAAAGSSTSAARQDHVHPTTGLLLTSQQTSLKAVNIYTSGAYPARPSGYGSVEWIGPVDPGASAVTNDTWVNTA